MIIDNERKLLDEFIEDNVADLHSKKIKLFSNKSDQIFLYFLILFY